MAKEKNELTFTGNAEMYADKISARISDEKTAKKLTMISATNAVSDFAGLKLAYYIASVTDADAKREDFKSATDMIMEVCNLKKSMVSNYRNVGTMVTDEDGNFVVPDAFRGFSVTQLLEAKAKLKTREAIETAVQEAEIDCTMSAKTIRENLTSQEEAQEDADRKARAKRSNMASNARKYGSEYGAPICIRREDGEEETIGYVIMTVAHTVFLSDIDSGEAYIKGSGATFSIMRQ